MANHKERLMDAALDIDSLKLRDADFTLKSKRQSPMFFNVGDFKTGKALGLLGQVYAEALTESRMEFDILYGIPEKGNFLAAATAIALARNGTDVPLFSTRKDAKTYGEASNLKPGEAIKALVVGAAPQTGQRIAQLDDVFTAGDAKYEALEVLKKLGNFDYPILAIAVDRQEVGIDGKSAIEEYEKRTGIKVVSIFNALDVYDHLQKVSEGRLAGLKGRIAEVKEKVLDLEKRAAGDQSPGPESVALVKELTGSREELKRLTVMTETYNPKNLARMATYLRVYGTPAARLGIQERVGKLEQVIIPAQRSVIPACDVETLEQFEELVKQTAGVPGIGGYKVGFELGLGYGLPRVVEAVRKHTDKPVIYDHQKAGTDIPDTGKNFARTCKKAGVDAVIFFPQAGPETERAWIYHALNQGLKVIVGGRMTHPAYAVSEGGFITDEGALEMYRIAARAGINNFVVPGNKPDVIKQVRGIIEGEGVSPVFYAPGLIEQGGKIADAAKAAGERFHGIVGRGIYASANMNQAAIEHTSQL